jgi:hypothetical protein
MIGNLWGIFTRDLFTKVRLGNGVVVQKLVPVIGSWRNLHARLCSDILAVRVIDIEDF